MAGTDSIFTDAATAENATAETQEHGGAESKTSNPKITRHALQRMQQRGITEEDVLIVLRYADMKSHVEDGLLSLSVRKRKLNKLVDSGEIPAQTADKVDGVGLVVSVVYSELQDKILPKSVVTVMHIAEKARHYRKSTPRKYRRRNR